MPASRKSSRRLGNLRRKTLGRLRRRRTLRLETLESRLALVGDISGTVFGDANSNGLFEPLLGEVGAANQFVYLDANSNGAVDVGEVNTLTSGTGTYSFLGVADGSHNVRLLLDPDKDQTVPTVNSGPNRFASLPNIVDHVFDATTGIDYASTSAGNIERFDSRTGLLLTPFKVGVSLGGLDVTPDGRYLYVAEQQPGTTQSFVRKVDTQTGLVINLGFNRIGNESGSFDITILNNGKALFTTLQVGGRVNLREVSLSTDAISLRSGLVGAADIAPSTRLNRNTDRSAVVFTEPDAVGNTFFYKTATDAFTARLALNTPLFLVPAAISRDGNRAAVATSGGVRIINTTTAAPTVVTTIPTAQLGGLAYDPNRDVLYVGNDASDVLRFYSYNAADTYTLLPSTISVGENINGTLRYLQLNIAPNGKLLTLGTATGIRSYPLYSQTTRVVAVSGAAVNGIDFGVHTFANVQATGTRDYYVMSNSATTLNVTAANGVIPNDRDPNLTQTLTARLVKQAKDGFVALNANGSFVYTSNPTHDVKDTFDYVINDGIVDSAPITATIARVSNKGSSISGREYLDLNHNGIYEPAQGETPIAGARVFLDLNNNGYWDPPSDPFLFTAADGTYNFVGIAAGTYHVRSEVPSGNRPTAPIAPVSLGLLLPLSGVKDFVFDAADSRLMYILTSTGSLLRYSLASDRYLASIQLPGSPSSLVVSGTLLFVIDSQEVANKGFVYVVNTVDGSVTTLSFDTPGAETGPVDIAVASGSRFFVTTGRSAAGTNPLHQFDQTAGPTFTHSLRTVPVGSGAAGTLAANTRMTGSGNILFQEGDAAGSIFRYDGVSNSFIDGPSTTGVVAGTQTAAGGVQAGQAVFASNQFGPSVFDNSYKASQIFSNTFNAGLAFSPNLPLLYAADGAPDVLIGYYGSSSQEVFRVSVGEDLATAPLKQATISGDGRTLVLGTPGGLRIFDVGLPGNNDVVLPEDTAISDINFGQEMIPATLRLDVPGGVMSEEQGPNALTGILTRSGPDLSQDLYVNLTSSDPSRVGLPVTVLIPAGQTSVTFSIDAIDNTVFDLSSHIVITALSTGAAPLTDTDFITLNDHETLAVTLSVPSIPENGGSTTGTVTRSNSNIAAALVVTLTSSDTSEATVPATVTIPANQSSVSFTVTAVDDPIYDGSRPAVISAVAAGYLSMDATINVVSDADSYRNILVSTVPTLQNSRLQVFSPAGSLLSDIPVPVGTGGDAPVRDLVVDSARNVEFYNGTSDPILSILDPRRGTFSSQTTAGWSTANFSSFGGIASLGNYIYVTDMATGTGADLQQGLIRYNITDSTFTRFATTLNFIDVAAGQDGLIYAFEFTPTVLPAVPAPPYNVWVYDPANLAFVRTVALVSPELPLAIAVNPQGQIFAVNGDNLIYEFNPNGSLRRTLSTGGTNLNDIDISPEGQLIAAGATGSVVVMNDPGHDLPSSFTVGNTQAFVAFGNLNRADGLTLDITPTTFSEAAGPTASAATITRPSLADLSISLVVTLASSDESEAVVPQTVTIPAFQATATFYVAAIDDALGDFTQNVTLTALAPGQIGVSTNLTVLDDEINYFTVSILPSSMPENGGSATGTVTRFVLDKSLPLVVNLSSGDTTEATVPATVTILANQDFATFPITAVDDAIRDATQNPVITASAVGMSNGTASVAVTDDEIDTISLGIVPGTISENGGSATGTVNRFVGNNLSPLVVSLSSNDTTEATVPATVTIPAGQNSVTFAVTGVNDAVRDFNQAVVVTASAAGVASTTANLTVNDDELDVLAITIANNFMMENGGTISATVTRTVLSNLLPQVVNLSSSDTTEATVPATVTIPGGSSTFVFTISAVDDALLDGPQNVTITASAAGFSSGVGNAVVGDNELPYQNQRNVLDVDASGGVFALDALKVINVLNEIGTGLASVIMASYVGPTIYPDTNGDNSITANDVLLVVNFLNLPPPPAGEGEVAEPMTFSPAAMIAVPTTKAVPSTPTLHAPQPVSSPANIAAVLAIVTENDRRSNLEDAPRGKQRHGEWDELVGDLANDLVKRRRD
ncbi:MAG: Ig-like domain-containing protein [Pirellulaceae bacterium]